MVFENFNNTFIFDFNLLKKRMNDLKHVIYIYYTTILDILLMLDISNNRSSINN